MTKFIQVTTTVSLQEDADLLAKLALEQRLAACVQISPCRSTYHWQGSIKQDNELRLVMKSHQDLYPALEKLIVEHHPYDVPEILVTPIESCNSVYLDWLAQELNEVK